MTLPIAALGPLPAAPPAWTWASADRALLSRVLSESRVERVPARPAIAEYVQAWTDALWRALERFLARHQGLWESVTWGLKIAAWLLVATAVVLLLLAILRVLRRRSRPAASASAQGGREPVSARASGDRGFWRQELERRLACGDVDGALEALWWWFASSIVREVDPSWTSRELLGAARRSDLTFAAVELDRALYAPRRPRPDDVSGLLARLERALP